MIKNQFLPDKKKSNKSFLVRSQIFLFIIISLSVFLRLYKIGCVPINYDEGFCAYVAFEMLTGKVPYKDVVYNHPPIFLYLSVLIYTILNPDILFVRLISVFSGILTTIFLYFLGKELYNENIGLLATLFYAIDPFSVVQNRIAFQESLMVFFIILSAYFFVKYWHTQNERFLILSGILIGIGSMTKLTGSLFLVSIIFSSLLIFNKDRALLKEIFIIVTCALFIPAITIIYFAFLTNSSFIKFVFIYQIERQALDFYLRLTNLQNVFVSNILLWSLGLVGIFFTFLERNNKDYFVLMWFLIPLISFLLVTRSLFPHYFLYVIPPLCLYASKISYKVFATLKNVKLSHFNQLALLLIFILGFGYIGFKHFSYSTLTIEKEAKFTSFQKEVAFYIKSNSPFNARIFSTRAEFAFLSQRENVKVNNWPSFTDKHIEDGVITVEDINFTIQKEKPYYILIYHGGKWFKADEIVWDTLKDWIEIHYCLEKKISDSHNQIMEIWKILPN